MLKLKLQYFGHLMRRVDSLWCWEGLGAGGEGDDRGWDGWMASPTWWTWVWVNSGRWWWTGRPGMLWFMRSQRVEYYWATELTDEEHLRWEKIFMRQGSQETYHQALHFWGDGFRVMTKILSKAPTFKCWKSSTWCFGSHLQLGDTVLKLALLSKLLLFNPTRSFHFSNNVFHNLYPHSVCKIQLIFSVLLVLMQFYTQYFKYLSINTFPLLTMVYHSLGCPISRSWDNNLRVRRFKKHQ